MRYFFFILLVIFSCSAFSQTEEKSLHPRLDKYYPQKDNTPPPAAAPEIVTPPMAETKPVPETKTVVEAKPVVQANPTVQPKPVVQQKPSTEEKPVVETPPALETKPMIETQPLKLVNDSSSLNKPVSTVIAQPEQKKIQTSPPPKPTSVYMNTRLGSSSPLYDTYEKNSNGAGSITSMPKR